jgi:hypothetical protein
MPTISIDQAIEDIRNGKMVILVDDEDRETKATFDHGRRKGDARGHQLHGQIRPGSDLPALWIPSKKCRSAWTCP